MHTSRKIAVRTAVALPALAGAVTLVVLGSPGPASAAATVPGAPGAVTGTAGDGRITVGWQPPASNGGSTITSYTASCVTGTTAAKTATAAGSARTAVVTGLTDGKAYTCRVVAKNAIGTGPASAATPAITPTGPPSAPLYVSASTSGTVLSVAWQAPTSTGGSAITGYTVSCTSTDGGATLTHTVAATARSTTLSGLPANHSYACTVKATNAKGTSTAGTAADIVQHATLTAAGQIATLHLPVTAGQSGTMRGTGSTLSSTACETMAIHNVSGATLNSGCLYKNESDFLTTTSTFTAAGTATATLTPPAGATGSVELAAWAFTNLKATLAAGAPAVTFHITAPGQTAVYSIAGTTGEKLTVTTSASTDTGTLSLRNPANNEILFGRWYTGETDNTGPTTLPATATYQLIATPDSYATGATTIRITKS